MVLRKKWLWTRLRPSASMGGSGKVSSWARDLPSFLGSYHRVRIPNDTPVYLQMQTILALLGYVCGLGIEI